MPCSYCAEDHAESLCPHRGRKCGVCQLVLNNMPEEIKKPECPFVCGCTCRGENHSWSSCFRFHEKVREQISRSSQAIAAPAGAVAAIVRALAAPVRVTNQGSNATAAGSESGPGSQHTFTKAEIEAALRLTGGVPLPEDEDLSGDESGPRLMACLQRLANLVISDNGANTFTKAEVEAVSRLSEGVPLPEDEDWLADWFSEDETGSRSVTRPQKLANAATPSHEANVFTKAEIDAVSRLSEGVPLPEDEEWLADWFSEDGTGSKSAACPQGPANPATPATDGATSGISVYSRQPSRSKSNGSEIDNPSTSRPSSLAALLTPAARAEIEERLAVLRDEIRRCRACNQNVRHHNEHDCPNWKKSCVKCREAQVARQDFVFCFGSESGCTCMGMKHVEETCDKFHSRVNAGLVQSSEAEAKTEQMKKRKHELREESNSVATMPKETNPLADKVNRDLSQSNEEFTVGHHQEQRVSHTSNLSSRRPLATDPPYLSNAWETPAGLWLRETYVDHNIHIPDGCWDAFNSEALHLFEWLADHATREG